MVPKADKITVNLKASGKTVATKDIEIPRLGTTGSITITNDDIYTGPDIPEPDKDKVNVYVKYNGKFKDDIKEIAFCNYYNSDEVRVSYKIDAVNVIVTDDGFVVTNFIIPQNWSFPMTIVLRQDYSVKIATSEMIAYDTMMNNSGNTIEFELQPQNNIIKLNITYTGDDYSKIHYVKFDGTQLPNSHQGISVNATSKKIDSLIVSINNNTDITISIAEWDIWNPILRYTIPWSDIQAHLGDELDVTIDPK